MKISHYLCLVFICLFSLPAAAAAQAKDGEEIKDFPPGLFSDRQNHHLTDYKGKVVFLYFFDSSWVDPGSIKFVAQKFAGLANDAATKYKDKPYKFFAVGSGTSQQAFTYASRYIGLKPVIPVFADNLGIMQKRYGQKIAGQKAVHLVVIGTGGSMMEDVMLLQSAGANELSYSKDAIQTALDKHHGEPKFNVKDYDSKLEPAIQAFEWNDYVTGMKLLNPLRKGKGKVAQSGAKLYDEIKKEGESWKEQADQAKDDKPVLAYDLYKKVQKAFAGTDLAKEVGPPLKEMAKNKALLKELEARKDMARLDAQLAQMTPTQSKQAAALCKQFAKKHAGTPTGEQAKVLAAELGS